MQRRIHGYLWLSFFCWVVRLLIFFGNTFDLSNTGRNQKIRQGIPRSVPRKVVKVQLTLSSSFWFILRLLLAISFAAEFLQSEATSNVDWTACALIAGIFPFVLWLWLQIDRAQRPNDADKPFSLTAPFFPMRPYTFRFWFTASIVQITAGAASSAVDFSKHGQINPLSASFLFLGLFCSLAVVIAMRFPLSKSGKS